MKEDELIKVLHLEDDPDDSELVLTELGTLPFKIDYTRVDCEKDFRYQLEQNHFDIILADYNLPSFNGISALKICSECYPEIPFIIVSGTLGEDIAVQMLKYGASDYLLKQNLKRLATAVEHSLEEASLKQDKIKAEIELRESEEKFRTITENSADAIFVADQTGRYVFTNNRVTEMLGFSREEMISKTITDLAPENLIDKFNMLFNRLLAEGKVIGELELLKKDGSFLPVDLNAVILPGGFLYGSCRDITERIKASRDLEAAALRWVSTFDAISDTVYIVSKDYKILAMNRAGLENPVFSVEKTIGSKCYECIHNTSGPIPDCPCAKIKQFAESTSFEYEQDNKFYHLQVWPIPDADGKFESSVHILKDITDRKLTQKALEESEKKYRSIFENIQDVYYRINNDGIITEISPSIQRLSGYTSQELIGVPVSIFYYYPEERNQLLEKLSKNSEVWDYEVRMRTKDGMTKYTSLNAHLLLNSEGNPDGIEGSLRDIDERKHFELKLEEAKDRAEESDRLKTAFLHNISHEIRTPMNAIIGFSTILEEEDTTSENQKSFIKAIQEGSNQLLSIINDIVDISSIEANILKKSITKVNINDILESLYTQFQLKAVENSNSIQVTPGLRKEDAQIETDSTKLIQILSNLISNALKFTKNGKVEIGYKVKESMIEFFVSDTGIGIIDDQHLRIFENFYQVENELSRQYGGTGLGLAISKAYTELLGGKIWLQSEPGKGSTFYFNVPYINSESEVQREKEIKDFKYLKFKQPVIILVAEDDDQNFNLILHFLSDPQVKIMRALNGNEAVNLCKANNFDLVLMDLKMPLMDGYTATKIIKEHFPNLPVIAQTAFVTDTENAMASGCDDFLSKPFTREGILSIIHKHL
ncbi:MAG: PAS domain S-box protein [Bacteroidales bacterium]|nr:PAS domain S-box protein [Bacteroidales bacterium]